ncbi:hypothetical protein HORIV_60790 [Vreelandella olivaria]|uniref:Response regulatory domain-containing protein n=1 Tax=Vreelandella olivaria TaxID=390919 RepID=A0ABM7GSL0_9GAMM|nr:hypothetical protein HORIV_60790 [Halomonas olivaria]
MAEPFDAVLTDVEMPVMDGFALTARLRENEIYRYRPIIIITSREKRLIGVAVLKSVPTPISSKVVLTKTI